MLNEQTIKDVADKALQEEVARRAAELAVAKAKLRIAQAEIGQLRELVLKLVDGAMENEDWQTAQAIAGEVRQRNEFEGHLAKLEWEGWSEILRDQEHMEAHTGVSAPRLPLRIRNDYPPEFEEAWRLYPKREGGNPKAAAYKAWRARIKEGVPPQALIDAVQRYASYIEALETRGEFKSRRFVMQAATFFGPNERWKDDYAIDEPEANPYSPYGD